MAHARALRLFVLAALCPLALHAASATAAKKASPLPAIASIGPATASAGDALTIRGSHFLAGRGRNTVLFRTGSGGPVSVRAGQATRTRMTVVVPPSLERRLSVKDGVAIPTRFRVRIRARRLGKGSTAMRRSILIRPTRASGGPPPGCADPGLAGDLLDTLDNALGTDLGDTLLPGEGCDPAADPAVAAAAGDDPAADDDPADDPAPGDDDPGIGEPPTPDDDPLGG